MSPERAKDWLSQAENDLDWATHSLSGRYFAQTCFISQQVAEKALKAILYHRNAGAILTHSLSKMLRVLGVNGELQRAASVLDLYYVGARYPDLLVEGTPSETFGEHQAVEAVALAKGFLLKARSEIGA